MHNINLQGIKNFKGLKNALRSISEIHSYTLDLGFALGLLQQFRNTNLSFHIDGSGYRPAKLTSDEWMNISGTCKFHLKPHYKKNGVFHSKAWIFKKSLLLGSSNLSIREARENLNFWCWLPNFTTVKLPSKESFTVLWDLNKQKAVIKGTPLSAIQSTLAGIKMTSMVIVSPQPPSKKMIRVIGPHLADKGDCLLFLLTESHGLKNLPNQKNWRVHNFIPSDGSNGLHGKAFYGEWEIIGKSGAILYIGSANFTEAAFTGKNIETGVLIKVEGNKQITMLRKALSSLLGKNGTVSKNEKAWATERFDGWWKKVHPPEKRPKTKDNLFLSAEDIAHSKFMDDLWASGNCLHFPATYGEKNIKKAELKLGTITRYWRKPLERKFESVKWLPNVKLKLSLDGGKTKEFFLPPLAGLMEGEENGSELLNLLLYHSATAGFGNSHNNVNGDPYNNLSFFSDPRVLVPWQTFVANNKTDLFYDKTELKTVLKTISAIIKEPKDKDKDHINQKLKNFAFCIESLIQGGA